MRKCLLIATTLLCSVACQAQKIYGTSTAAGVDLELISFDPANNTFATIIKKFEYYQPTSTKDTLNKVLYYMVPNMNSANSNPDTLVTVKLRDTTLTKIPIAKGTLGLPQYYNGKLIGVAPNGIASFDLATNQYSIINNTVHVSSIHSSDIDLTNGRYFLMKRGNGSNVGSDTIYVYNITTNTFNTLLTNTVGSTSEMTYSPTSNKLVFQGAQNNTANLGIYSYSFATNTCSLETLVANNGTLVNSGTFDAVNNRYFVVRLLNGGGTNFNIIEYRLNTSTLIDHLVGIPGLGFCQYFDNMKLPTVVHTAVGNVEAGVPFTMYPNPVTDQLNVNIDLNGQNASLQVLDITGKVIINKAAATATNQLNISKLAAGKYILRIAFKDNIYSRVFIKGN